MTGTIDLNADCGESFGRWTLGDDAALLQSVTSANIACGAHAGDPEVMRATARLCVTHGVAIGAHPGYPDLAGFGRRILPMTPAEVFNTVLAQIGTLAALVKVEGGTLAHVKPHGALYNHAARTPDIARAIADAVAAFDARLILFGLAGSGLIEAGRAAGLRVAAEAFADRAYEADGRLRERALPGAVLTDDARALDQALRLARHGEVLCHDGTRLPLRADTVCVHGDTAGAAARARTLREGLQAAGLRVAAPGQDRDRGHSRRLLGAC